MSTDKTKGSKDLALGEVVSRFIDGSDSAISAENRHGEVHDDKPEDTGGEHTRRHDARVTEGPPVDLIEDSFVLLAPQGERLVSRFYEELLGRYPEVRPLFANTTMESQQKKLLAALQLVVKNLRKPETLGKVLEDLGVRHYGYGVQPHHYRLVAETLLDVMAEVAGPRWTPAFTQAWRDALNAIAEKMLKAYSNSEDSEMVKSNGGAGAQAGESGMVVIENITVLQDILEHAPINIMIADADENIIFVNRKAREVLGGIEQELAKYLPGFSVNNLVGGSIHRYHRDPTAIKRLLQSLTPGVARHGEITPGDYVFEHETRVLVNGSGDRLGYIVQWQDVTEKRQREEQAQRLQRAVDGAQVAMMTIDRDLVITYVNQETRELMARNAEALRKLYPGFNPENLLGTCIDIFHKNPAHQRRLLADESKLPYETDINVGPLTFHIRVSAIHDLKGTYVGNTLEWSDVTELRMKETDVARLKSAIDGASTNLMICDAEMKISYVNPAVVEMLAGRQEHLRKLFPGFDAHNLQGKCIDMFHKNPAHQRALLTDTNRLPYHTEISVAGLEFELNATAIIDAKGQYMGNMVEWKDITEQKDAERQIQELIDAAARGDLNKRVETESYEGFMRNLGEGINRLMGAVIEPIRECIRVMSSVAQGDISLQMDGHFDGEFAILQESINSTLSNLVHIIGGIRESAVTITSAAGEIAQGNRNLSERTEEQASSLEETASSMEELTSTVKQNADNASQANTLASDAREQAEKGGQVVESAINAMSEINGASKKIADIISVIDEIAFQTNLLALNAAVEAARAGEQGRGFAVVATEVRNLAQRSAGAAKEIKTLIKDSVEKVEDGSRLVNQSGETLEEIVGAVKRVSDIIAEIAAASQEQSSGIEQVNKAVMQMDEVTQQNAALVEEAAAASESLDEQARSLEEMVTFFKVGDTDEQGNISAQPVQRPARQAQQNKRPTETKVPRNRKQAPAGVSTAAMEEGQWEEF